MADPTPSTQRATPGRLSMPGGVGVYERPRTAWAREHIGLLLGLLLSLVGFAIFAIRQWA